MVALTNTLPKIAIDDLQYIQKKAFPELKKLSGSGLLLTGAGGFLGYYLLLTFLSWNDTHPTSAIDVTALSRFGNGIPAWLAAYNRNTRLTLISSDITTQSLPKKKYEYIIHAASFASPVMYRKFPIQTINANVLGLYKLLDDIHNYNSALKKLLYFSSSEIYGDPTPGNVPTPEEYRGNVSCTGPRACYDESKRFCETLCVNYVRSYHMPIVIARPFNNYGPGMKIDDGRVIADFARDILANRDIIMYSDGKPSRTYCYVADAIIGYIKLLINGKSGEAYNIGTPEPEISVLKLAQLMTKIGKRHFGYNGSIRLMKSNEKEYLTDNPSRRCPRIDKAIDQLGYSPSITLEDGILKALQWYKEAYLL